MKLYSLIVSLSFAILAASTAHGSNATHKVYCTLHFHPLDYSTDFNRLIYLK
jgi:hypothetical protein